MTAHDFAGVPLLARVPEAELEWLAERCEARSYAPGEVIFVQGEPVAGTLFLLSGRADLFRREGGRETAFLTVLAGEVTGQLPYSRMQKNGATGYAAQPTRTAVLSASFFPELHAAAPETLQRLVNLMLDRTREFTRYSEQQERLASLGTMAAGLAHELNNPAAAAHRAAQTLLETLGSFDEHSSKLLSGVIFKTEPRPEDGDPFAPIYNATTLQPAQGAVERGELEDDLSDYLDAHGVPRPWDAAAVLAAGGLTRETLEPFMRGVMPEKVQDVLAWTARDVELRLLVGELLESTKRISELVGAMKAYSYLDQASEKRPTDLREGLVNTLTILKHKFKKKGVRLLKTFGELPSVPAYGAELNQVWTNLLDNAVAAAPEGGTVAITTALDASGTNACIDIADDGPGIPEGLQARIFEPFFTTKGVGEGTGLGLDIAQKIVARRHGGSIQVRSQPGETHFTVRLPLS